MENYLQRHGLSQQRGLHRPPLTVLPYHAAIDPKLRPANLEAFMAPPTSSHIALVCTDRASRGLDSAACGHVVLFDLPRDPSEYVRRAGRCASGAPDGDVNMKHDRVYAYVLYVQPAYAHPVPATSIDWRAPGSGACKHVCMALVLSGA